MTTARPTLGAFVLLGGIVCVALMDAVAKILSADVPVVEITWRVFFFHGILMTPFVLMSAADRKAIFIRQSPKAWGLHLLRGLLLSVASLCFFIAIKQNPVPDSLAVFFICPLIVIVIARIFLGEALSRRLFIAAGCGLIGVLIVLRPGGDTGYHWTIIFALGTAICFSGYIVLARFASLNKTPVMVTSWLTAVFCPVAHPAVYGGGINNKRRAAMVNDDYHRSIIRFGTYPNYLFVSPSNGVIGRHTSIRRSRSRGDYQLVRVLTFPR